MNSGASITAADYAGEALLAVHGELPPPALIERLRREHSILVAADGAALQLRSHSIRPDVIIGDLDSIGAEDEAFAADGTRVIRLESQEANDLEKALRWLAGEGIRSATLIGMAGGATDHTLNNFSILPKFARTMRLRLCDADSVAYVIPDSITLDTTPGDRISLIPLPSAIITTAGLAWPLRNELLAIGLREGASNRATEPRIEVRVSEGVVVVFHYAGRLTIYD